MSFSVDPQDKFIENAAKGATKAAIEYSEEKILKLAKRFLNKEISFVEDPDAINTIKIQKKMAEFQQFKHYVKDRDLRVLCQMGLTLRQYEKEGKEYYPLVKKINKKYGKEGLHVAWFIQNGLFSKYLAFLMETGVLADQIGDKILSFLQEIDSNVSFVSLKDVGGKNSNNKIIKITSKINVKEPDIFIISSMGDAMPICKKIIESIKENLSDYDCEIYDSPQKGKKIYFLIRNDIDFSV